MASPTEALPDVQVFEEDGIRKAIGGFTWPGIEYGEPPSCPYTYFEYVDALRFGDIRHFKKIERECEGWWFPTLDRGAGAPLHFAVDHGQFAAIKYLIEQRGVEVNQRDKSTGWTVLHRCARVVHYKYAPFFEIFEYLLQKGADPGIRSFSCPPDSSVGEPGKELDVVDVAVHKGFGWERGEVRAKLQALMEKYKDAPKKPAYIYRGPEVGELACDIIRQWEALPKLYPPDNWQPPPPAGYEGASGMRRASREPWRPAGQNDGSAFLRPMTEEELARQAEEC